MANPKQPVHSVQDLFAAALELPPERRSAFLEAACHDAPDARKLLRELLAENDRAGSFLTSDIFSASSGTEPTIPDTPGGGLRIVTPERFRPLDRIANRFQVVRFIDRGGMGEVYEVRDEELQGTAIALKIIRPDIAADAASSLRFKQEVLLARKVSHPNLCPIYDIGRCDQPPPPLLYLTMKLLRGQTLDARLKSSPPLPLADAIEICTQLIRGVGAIHAAGVIHRDLKPNNIMLETYTGKLCVSIMDFGLARLHEAEHSVAGTAIAGTPGYIAPELFHGKHPTEATDLFALGVVLHMTLSGLRPVDDPKTLGLKPAPSLLASSAPPQLIAAIEDLLSNNPEQRCHAFNQLHAAVESHQPIVYRSRRALSRRGFIAAASASACAFAGAALWRRQQIYDWAHPLPSKRFVAVLNWPPNDDPRIRAMINGLLDSIANELSRAEAYDHNFFVTTPRQTPDLHNQKELVTTSESLGTNLVLAASAAASEGHVRVLLSVLGPNSLRLLRSAKLDEPTGSFLQLPRKVVYAAADLLGVRHYGENAQDAASSNNPAAVANFEAAEALMKEPNNAGLGQAIENYKLAVDQDPRYPQAHAHLALAYLRLYYDRRDASSLILARGNAEAAVALDSGSVDAHVALASFYQATGADSDALHQWAAALALDPRDARTITYQGQTYWDMGRWAEAEECYARVLKLRPNYWVARNELGDVYNSRAQLDLALSEYKAAALLNPKSALVLNNVASVYFQLGRLPQALDAINRSLMLSPSDSALTTKADILRAEGKYEDSLHTALAAVDLVPSSGFNWLEVGDSYAALPHCKREATDAYARGLDAQVASLNVNPSDGPGTMIVALLKIKTGQTRDLAELIRKAESLGASDMYSQLIKVRILELTGQRSDALATLTKWMSQGVTPFQVSAIPDLGQLRNDPRYIAALQQHSRSAVSDFNSL